MNTRRAAIGTRQAGFTLVEVIVVLVLLASAVSVIVNLIASSSGAQRHTERMARAAEINQLLINSMRSEVLSTVELFTAGSVGQGYLDALELDPSAPRLAGSTLSTVIIEGGFRQETTSGELTGNCLLTARQAWTTELTCGSGATYLIDVYRLVHFYLSEEDGGPVAGSPTGLNMALFVSEPLADGDQIDSIVDNLDQQEMLTHLATGTPDDLGVSHPVAVLVWTRGQDISVSGALREIDPGTGSMVATPISPRPSGAWQINRDVGRSQADMLNYRRFSVTTNHARAGLGVGRFGLITHTGSGFPHGFEVQIAGAGAARQVLLHLSVVTTNNSGSKAHSDLRSTVFVHDL